MSTQEQQKDMQQDAKKPLTQEPGTRQDRDEERKERERIDEQADRVTEHTEDR